MNILIGVTNIIFISLLLISPTYAIVGPSIEKSEYPRQSCLILYYDKSRSTVQSLCSGTLVSSNQVLTAGHCEEAQTTSPTLVICDHGTKKSWVQDRDTHFRYSSAGEGNDIALLEVSKSFTTPPMKIAKNQLEITKLVNKKNNCAIFGFGLDSDGNAGKLNGTVAQFSSAIFGLHMAGLGTSRYALQGDSGGGLSCKNEQGKWVRVGTISRATPGISIAEYLTPNLEWLLDHLFLTNKKKSLENPERILKQTSKAQRDVKACLNKLKNTASSTNEDITQILEGFAESKITINQKIRNIAQEFYSISNDNILFRVLVKKIKKQNKKLQKISSACTLKITDLKTPKIGQTYKVDVYAWMTLANKKVVTTGTNKSIFITISKIEKDDFGKKIVIGNLVVMKGKSNGTQIGAGSYESVKLPYDKLLWK